MSVRRYAWKTDLLLKRKTSNRRTGLINSKINTPFLSVGFSETPNNGTWHRERHHGRLYVAVPMDCPLYNDLLRLYFPGGAAFCCKTRTPQVACSFACSVCLFSGVIVFRQRVKMSCSDSMVAHWVTVMGCHSPYSLSPCRHFGQDYVEKGWNPQVFHWGKGSFACCGTMGRGKIRCAMSLSVVGHSDFYFEQAIAWYIFS